MHVLLLIPAAILCGLLALVVIGAWVNVLLNDPGKFSNAPAFIQVITRSVYVYTRTIWQRKEDCIEFDPDTLYRPSPGACHFSNVEFSTVMHFDESGARRTAAPSGSAAGHFTSGKRIVVLGDSHAMGWGVEDHETFASRLAIEYGFTTINLGVSSFGTIRELLRLEKRFELEANDIIVIQYSDNDLRENGHFLAHGRVGPYQPAQLKALVSYRPIAMEPLPIAGWLLRHLLDVFVINVRNWARKLTNSPDDPAPDNRAAMVLLGVLRAFPMLRNHNVIIVPINGPNYRSHLEAGRAAIESAGLTFVSPSLGHEQFLQIDDHMTPTGHRIVAASIADAIEAGP